MIVKEQLALDGELLNSATYALSTAAASKDLIKGRQTETSMNQNPKHICVAQFGAGTSKFVQVHVSWTRQH